MVQAASGAVYDHTPLASSLTMATLLAPAALASAYTLSDTDLAVGAHRRKAGTPAALKVAPSLALAAAPANSASSMPFVCSDVTWTSRPAPSNWAMANWPLTLAATPAASDADSVSSVAPARCGNLAARAGASAPLMVSAMPASKPVTPSGAEPRPPLAA